MTAADLTRRLRDRLADLEAQRPGQVASAQREAAILRDAQRGGNLAEVIAAQARASAAQGIADQAAADLADVRERLAQAEAALTAQERQSQAQEAAQQAARVAAAIDAARADMEVQNARLRGLEARHADLERQVRADLGQPVAQPGQRSGWTVSVSNLSAPVSRIDPDTLEALDL